MTHRFLFLPLLALVLMATTDAALADCPEARRPDGPPLARAGTSAVGVRDFRLADRDDGRVINVSLWYPAASASNPRINYRDALGSGPGDPGRPVIPFDFCGQARVDAAPASLDQAAPTVLISHGFPGSKVLMAWLGEHLASHGFAVVGINHAGATHADRGDFAEVLVNKPKDLVAVLDAIKEGQISLNGMALDGSRVGLVGYSMGGYAALVGAGAGLNPVITGLPQLENVSLSALLAPRHHADPRIAAVVALAPWGAPEALERVGLAGLSLWQPAALASIRTPLLLISGDADQISGYERGARWIFKQATSPSWLLTYHQARHNVAPMPPPPISREALREFNHYAEPVWDIERLNDLNRHYILAFFRAQLTGDGDALNWLMPHRNGSPLPPGFVERDAIGFSLEQGSAAP